MAINEIKQFFENISYGSKTKRLNYSQESAIVENNFKLCNDPIPNEVNNQKEKKEWFEIYNKIKNGEYNLQELTEEQRKKIIAILKYEISLKKEKLDHDITELNILKVDNKINEKNRILNLYNGVKNKEIDLSDIDKEDLLKIRKLLIKESKM